MHMHSPVRVATVLLAAYSTRMRLLAAGSEGRHHRACFSMPCMEHMCPSAALCMQPARCMKSACMETLSLRDTDTGCHGVCAATPTTVGNVDVVLRIHCDAPRLLEQCTPSWACRQEQDGQEQAGLTTAEQKTHA